MTLHTSVSATQQTPADRAARNKRIASVLVLLLIQAVILFGTAGRLDWTAAWVYLLLYLGLLVVNAAILLPRHPDLLAERGRIGENAKQWDKVLAPLVSLVFPFVSLAAAGLDMRNVWTTGLSPSIPLIGLAITILGFAITSWSMFSNRFFSGVVRIQTDRGHTVAKGGPYRIVRHPGYVGMITFNLGIPLLLGSLVALVLAVITVLLFILRTALEDRTLQQELPGYADYASQVRYRLLPGIW